MRLLGEAGAAQVEKHKDELEKIRTMTADYPLDRIFNADETGFFFRSLPNLTVTMSNEAARGGKKEKSRITAVLCANVIGTCKMSITIIGKAVQPNCFRKGDLLPVIYESQHKAWMDMVIFNKFFSNFKREVRQHFPDG